MGKQPNGGMTLAGFAGALLLLVSTAAFAQAPLKVLYGGFAFIGNHADNDKAFRFSRQLIQERASGSDRPQLEAELMRRVAGVKNSSFELVADERMGDYKKGDSLALAFALEWENAAIERAGDVTKLVLDVHAQVLVFDFAKDEMKIVAVYPVAVQLRDAVRGDVSDAHILSRVREMYYGAGPTNIFDQFVARLASIALKKSYPHRIQVKSVVVEDAARGTVAEGGGNADAFGRFAAQSFGRFLSQNMRVSVLPHSTGEAIGGKMAARFANGDVFNLTIPEADYVVTLRLQGFKKVLLGENRAEKAWGYGSYAAVKFEQPELAKRYLDSEFKYAAVKKVPATVTQTDDWSAYQESLFSLFDQLTKQFAAPSPEWMKRWSGGDAVAAQVAEAAKMIEKCR
jgi:hypothetical protein